MLKTITYDITLDIFHSLLQNNPGLLIIKLFSTWCRPCNLIKNNVDEWFSIMSNNIQTVTLDIDKSFDVYAALKNKKMLSGIPAILMYKKGNITFIPNESVNSSNINEIDAFFMKCIHSK